MAHRYSIEEWDELESEREWPLLVVGNGASCAVSNKFGYTKLVTAANLTTDERAVFRALRTVNFESVLDYLRVSALICDQLGHGEDDAIDRYESIKESLIEAINDHHVEWGAVPTTRLEAYRRVLLNHSRTWCTSYDLISYWGIMADKPYRNRRIGDCFWNQGSVFDPTNAEPNSPTMPMIYWVHGALHLYTARTGETVKRSHSAGSSLLNLLGQPFRGADLPLFVSEGTARQKMRAIRGSEYLSHAYSTLAESEGPLVVFGQAFGDMDSHLVAAVNKDPRRHIAYSICASSRKEANLLCANVERLFPHARVRFFDAGTHPLG